MNVDRDRVSVDVLWFRRDLRTFDNPILSISNRTILPVFIFDMQILKDLNVDDQRLTYIFKQVERLKNNLRGMKLDLLVFYGKPLDVFEYVEKNFYIQNIYANADNDTYSRERDNNISKRYRLHLLRDAFILNPEDIKTSDGGVYTIFSFFKKAVVDKIIGKSAVKYEMGHSNKLPDIDFSKIIKIDNDNVVRLPFAIESLDFKEVPLHYIGAILSPDELLDNLAGVVEHYEINRDIPSYDATSHIGCALRFGTLSVREVLRRILKIRNSSIFLNEIIWREFFNYLLYHFPETQEENLKRVDIKWREDSRAIKKWKSGETGIPIVDAGIRQLLSEGFMHNRVRMIVASFLTKNLHINWQIGEKFFASLLMDYEASSNIGNWQWVAGVGADPKSLYRIFNPFLQAQKFDSNATYIKKYIPELSKYDPSLINSYDFVYSKGLKNYPSPIVDIKESARQFKMLFHQRNNR